MLLLWRGTGCARSICVIFWELTVLDNRDYEIPEEQPEQEVNTSETVAAKEKPWQKTMLEYLRDLSILLSVAAIVLLLCFRVVIVEGDSMKNTLKDGDYLLLLSSTFYHNPQYGDVIVASKDDFKSGEPIVKRVIATEGQWVDIRDGVVYISNDGMKTWEPLDEAYINTTTSLNQGVTYMQFPVYVEENCLFVMGDNRNVSLDSRSTSIGLIDKREVVGKVIFLFLPGADEELGEQRDFGRIGAVD